VKCRLGPEELALRAKPYLFARLTVPKAGAGGSYIVRENFMSASVRQSVLKERVEVVRARSLVRLEKAPGLGMTPGNESNESSAFDPPMCPAYDRSATA
jgi:hypothetical protein